ncbi:hypothetical protein [Lederbergia citrisecunda]|nr:hypothetical protein [Lederbergia citrisecunda]
MIKKLTSLLISFNFTGFRKEAVQSKVRANDPDGVYTSSGWSR